MKVKDFLKLVCAIGTVYNCRVSVTAYTRIDDGTTDNAEWMAHRHGDTRIEDEDGMQELLAEFGDLEVMAITPGSYDIVLQAKEAA